MYAVVVSTHGLPGGTLRLHRCIFPISFILLASCLSLLSATVLPAEYQAFVQWSSTNLINLRNHPMESLLTSCLILGRSRPWIPVLLLSSLFPLSLRFGNIRALVIVFSAHMVATFLSQGILAVRIAGDKAPAALASMDDYGTSYVYVAALAAVILYGRVLFWRFAALSCLCVKAEYLLHGIDTLEVEPVGHSASFATAAILGRIFARTETGSSEGTRTSDRVTERPPQSSVSTFLRWSAARLPRYGRRDADVTKPPSAAHHDTADPSDHKESAMSRRTYADQIEVAATPAAIFRIYSDVENWSRWDRAVHRSAVDRFETGGRGFLKSRNGPKSRMEILEVVDGVSFTTKFRLPLCRLWLKYELRPAGDGKTLVVHSVAFYGTLAPAFARLFEREVRKDLSAGLSRIKSITENEAVGA